MQEVEKLVQQFRTKSNREALKIHSLKTIHRTPYHNKSKKNNLFLWAGPRFESFQVPSKYLNMFKSEDLSNILQHFCFFWGISTATPWASCHAIQSYDPKTVTLTAQSLVGAKEPLHRFSFFDGKCLCMRKDSKTLTDVII